MPQGTGSGARPGDRPAPPRDGSARAQDRPALPEQSREDTDAGWGERPEPDDDDRLSRDRPPHWGTD